MLQSESATARLSIDATLNLALVRCGEEDMLAVASKWGQFLANLSNIVSFS
jgi:hypothetical protein